MATNERQRLGDTLGQRRRVSHYLRSSLHIGGCIGTIVAVVLHLTQMIGSRWLMTLAAVALYLVGALLGVATQWLINIARRWAAHTAPPSSHEGKSPREYHYLNSDLINQFVQAYENGRLESLTERDALTDDYGMDGRIAAPPISVTGAGRRSKTRERSQQFTPTEISTFQRLERYLSNSVALHTFADSAAESTLRPKQFWMISVAHLDIELSANTKGIRAHATAGDSLRIEAKLDPKWRSGADDFDDVTVIARVISSVNRADHTQVELNVIAIFR